jgi:transcriptional regulator with XRE-family HTH domain
MNDLNKRVTKAIESSGHYASSVARALKISPEAVLQWMSGTTKTIKAENIFGLADLTGFSARWLATGEGPEIDSYRQPRIMRVISAMERMTPQEQERAANVISAFNLPPANDSPNNNHSSERSVGS